MSEEVGTKVVEIIAEQAMVEPSEIKDETTLDELGLDSLALVEVVFGIEESFDISVPYNANDPQASDFDIATVGKIVEGVKRLIAEREAEQG
ncbi:MAG: phosphopantetheine-binding protein [Pseudomonadota bacterium]